ncbi:UPF0223 family protein [Alkalihalobacillus pseudalcaliphilus]|uniref:UPF0223 family protein n=1 Tax=Alkalihalobacillus pseudalcaliphilus TaxID=79884 RepID=UPI00064E12A5|nr:UPF0223 family protein [Alkalihalobacillus pseudalcaliphilus]KMK77068.1 hypothetical protein AB990_05820 [Alkalihalobacillus pseudalcaliphilus]
MEMNMPISLDWTTDEVVDVVAFYEAVEQVYGNGIERHLFLKKYQRFKEIVPSKSEEKQLCAQFDQQVNVSSYLAVKEAKKLEDGEIVKL